MPDERLNQLLPSAAVAAFGLREELSCVALVSEKTSGLLTRKMFLGLWATFAVQIRALIARTELLSVGTLGSQHGDLCSMQKGTATSALIFSAVSLNQTWAQRRAVAAKVILSASCFSQSLRGVLLV